MALERGIALAAFAVGLAVVVLALAGCGEDDAEPPEILCDGGDFALPVVGARLIGDSTVRLAYAGGEPCSFAVDRYRGRVYVELRTRFAPDRREPFPSGCVEGALDFRVPPGTPIARVYGNPRLLDTGEIEDLLAGESECPAVAERSPAFIID